MTNRANELLPSVKLIIDSLINSLASDPSASTAAAFAAHDAARAILDGGNEADADWISRRDAMIDAAYSAYRTNTEANDAAYRAVRVDADAYPSLNISFAAYREARDEAEVSAARSADLVASNLDAILRDARDAFDDFRAVEDRGGGIAY